MIQAPRAAVDPHRIDGVSLGYEPWPPRPDDDDDDDDDDDEKAPPAHDLFDALESFR